MTILGIDPTDDGAIPEPPASVSTVDSEPEDVDEYGVTEEKRRAWTARERDETRALLAPWREKLLAFLLAEDDAGYVAEVQLEFYENDDVDDVHPERNVFTFRSTFQEPKSLCGLGPKFTITLARESV